MINVYQPESNANIPQGAAHCAMISVRRSDLEAAAAEKSESTTERAVIVKRSVRALGQSIPVFVLVYLRAASKGGAA